MFGVEFDDAALESRIAEGAERVEQRLAENVDSAEPFVAEAAAHLLNAGGKRFRPLLTLLAAELGAADASSSDDTVSAAVVVELTHLATLYHDDVMDEAAVRRGAPSANARWDNNLAILVGDYLFARASDLVATLGTEAVHLQAQTFSRLVHGQIRETIGPREGEDALTHYLGVVADKTGSLIATAARFGAMTSGAGTAVTDSVTEFGERIGVAFQLADDVLDIASDTDDSGKTPGTDLREGVPTLPTLIAMRSTDPADADLVAALRGPIEDEGRVQEVLHLLRTHPATTEAREHVQAEADAARALLAGLPDGAARDAMAALCDTVATRLG